MYYDAGFISIVRQAVVLCSHVKRPISPPSILIVLVLQSHLM
jgi:hypothetical protein